ncbi:Bax inhibitor-1/YccA family protein [Oceanirhabdus sp. W0125-5]|uniref:Bax inhibitor-1/YccA family protein n=1 Tax=Oceanirhabdus sp. W0125-5 TaxID=2999116 RepID=UPI0022F2BCD1|nr:Bax inhibitor-1/YccA family protein [Oceanirhabdus sp. W0125-5]WBW97536.1 Bax inhibitor-1/YccA family protein [Oceanirhabdus sp. W0125-5]
MYNDVTYKKSESNFINKTFMYMGMALLITFVTAFITANSQTMLNIIFSNRMIPFVLFGAEILIVVSMGRKINKLSREQMLGLLIVYSILNGLTFSAIFILYTSSSIATVFLIAAAMFFCSAMAGITAKRDLSVVGKIAGMALFGLIAIAIIGMFVPQVAANPLFSVIGVIVFCALTAYDMQKIKRIHSSSFAGDPERANKLAVMAALSLYLDFINIFLYLLRLFSRD